MGDSVESVPVDFRQHVMNVMHAELMGTGDMGADKTATSALSFEAFAIHQKLWSRKTFGPSDVRGPLGALDHLAKAIVGGDGGGTYSQFGSPTKSDGEATEAYRAAERFVDLPTPANRDALATELADCIFLVFDAAWRAGISLTELRTAMTKKLIKNQSRPWPDWRTMDPNGAIEHDRTTE